MMKIKCGMFEFEGSQVEFDQIVKSGLLDKCFWPLKIEQKKINEDHSKELFPEECENTNFLNLFYRQKITEWPKIDPAELGIDTLKAKTAYILSEDQRQDAVDN
jgi:hypothetical protein